MGFPWQFFRRSELERKLQSWEETNRNQPQRCGNCGSGLRMNWKTSTSTLPRAMRWSFLKCQLGWIPTRSSLRSGSDPPPLMGAPLDLWIICYLKVNFTMSNLIPDGVFFSGKLNTGFLASWGCSGLVSMFSCSMIDRPCHLNYIVTTVTGTASTKNSNNGNNKNNHNHNNHHHYGHRLAPTATTTNHQGTYTNATSFFVHFQDNKLSLEELQEANHKVWSSLGNPPSVFPIWAAGSTPIGFPMIWG